MGRARFFAGAQDDGEAADVEVEKTIHGIMGSGIPFKTLAIPAKAGIHFVVGAFPVACAVDCRFRGNACTWERPCLANDTTVPKNGLRRGAPPRVTLPHIGHRQYKARR